MVDIVDPASARAQTSDEAAKTRRPVPSWVITIGSLIVLLGAWEIFGRDINPVFGSYPSAIAEAGWQLARTGKLWAALLDSLRPFLLGYALAIVIGVPIGLVTGRFRSVEAAIGIYITAGYAMPLVALVPLLVLWGARLRVRGRGDLPDGGVSDLHQHLARRNRGAENPDRGRQVLRRARFRNPAADHPAGDAALHHGGHPPRRRPRRGRHGDRGVLHLDLRARRRDHHLRQQFRHRHHVRADRHPHGDGDRAQLSDRRGRALGRTLAGGDRGAGRVAGPGRALQRRGVVRERDQVGVGQAGDGGAHRGIGAGTRRIPI